MVGNRASSWSSKKSTRKHSHLIKFFQAPITPPMPDSPEINESLSIGENRIKLLHYNTSARVYLHNKLEEEEIG